MSRVTPQFGSAPTANPTARRLRPWRTRLVTRRARVQWQLVLVVTAIAVLACTLISSLALLVAATEVGAIRSALSAASADQKELRVTLTRPDGPLDADRAAMAGAIEDVFGDDATVQTQALTLSELYVLPRPDAVDPLFYLGDLEEITKNTTLASGEWPDAEGEVAIPEIGAMSLGLTVGDSLSIDGIRLEQADLTVTISGIYRIDDPESTYWASDLIDGAGLDPKYPVPGSAGALQTDAIGPLIVPAGSLDSGGTQIERIAQRVVPDFSAATVESMGPLRDRLAAAPDTAPAAIGEIGDRVEVTSRLTVLLTAITDAMAVTRSIVVVVSLLLFVLAVAALGQAARLLTEARMAERHLMRARGASARQVLGVAAGEALLIAVITVAASPFIARAVYVALAQQPAMVAAGMAGDPGIPPLVWFVAVLVGVLFWVVLVAPLLGREGSFQEGEQGKARQRRFSGLQRSGVDVALLVLAGVAYSQLLTYQGPTSSTALGVDPILVAGPALVMLAGAFLAVRLIPAAGLLTERIAARSRGAVVALASWEIGRRAQRATAAILLITLALAVGTFSHSFLATWKQSQVDQADFAVGAPLRLTSAVDFAEVPSSAQPVIRGAALVAGADMAGFINAPQGEDASVLGLTEDARAMLDRDRLGTEGGTIVADRISAPTPLDQAIALPADTLGVSATVRATSAQPLAGIELRMRMLLENPQGHQTTIDLGAIEVDGKEHRVSGTLPRGTSQNNLSIVAVQTVAYAKYPDLNGATARTKAELLIRDLASMGTPSEDQPMGSYPSRPIEVDDSNRWRATGEGADTANYPSSYAPDGWQLGLGFTVPQNLGSKAASYVVMAWPEVIEMPAVISQQLADTIEAKVADRLTVFFGDASFGVLVVGITPSVPGAGTESVITSLAGIGDDARSAIVVDELLLARALFQAGAAQPVVHEWWLDLEPGTYADYLPYLAVQYSDVTAQSAEQLAVQMQEDPLRVATQGALWLVIIGAAALAAVGFAVHSTGSLRSRATEFAQLRAVGLSRRRLLGIIGIESLLLAGLGTVFGIGLGLILAYLVGPLVGVSGDGTPPVPTVRVLVPVEQVALLVAELAVVLAAVILIAARVQRVAEPATALRQGEER